MKIIFVSNNNDYVSDDAGEGECDGSDDDNDDDNDCHDDDFAQQLVITC